MFNVLDGTETAASAITTLFEAITSVVTNILNIFGTVASTLMSNTLFQITMGLVILGIVIGLVFTFVRKVRKQGR